MSVTAPDAMLPWLVFDHWLRAAATNSITPLGASDH